MCDPIGNVPKVIFMSIVSMMSEEEFNKFHDVLLLFLKNSFAHTLHYMLNFVHKHVAKA